MNKSIEQLAQLIRQRNQVEAEITKLIGRPAQLGQAGEYIAAILFDIQLENPAAHKGVDAHFHTAPLAGKTVNVRWYGRQDFILDINPHVTPDTYLVFTGPVAGEGSAKITTRPWSIDAVYLFDAKEMLKQLSVRKLTPGPATNIPKKWWETAELYPSANSKLMRLTNEQEAMLRMFSSAAVTGKK